MHQVSLSNTTLSAVMPPLPAISHDTFLVAGSSYSKRHITSEITRIVDDALRLDDNRQSPPVYLHGSNSASLKALDSDGLGLLPAAHLNKLGKEISSGEKTDGRFYGQYGENGHDVVFTSIFESGFDSDIFDYMSYNTQTGNRYPVLYIISDTDNKAMAIDYKNHIFDTIPPNKIIGLLVPEADVEETSMRIREHFPHIQVNSLGNPKNSGQ